MPTPLRSKLTWLPLRSWLKEERRLLPERPLLQGVWVVSLLLLSILLSLELRRRSTGVEDSVRIQQQERLEQVSAALDDIRRTAFDWARWNDSFRYVQGGNPDFVTHDLAQTSLFSSGGVMVLFDRSDRLLISYGSGGADQPMHRSLVRCAQDNLGLLQDLTSAISLFCRAESGGAYLGILTRVSNNDSTAPPAGSLVMFEPLIRPAHGPRLRSQLRSLQDLLVERHTPGTAALPGRILLRGIGGEPIGLRGQSSLMLVLRSLLDDGGLLLVLLIPLLLARLRFTLAHRQQRLCDLRNDRQATGRIRRVCHQLDALLSQLGLDGPEASAQQRVMARLINPALLPSASETGGSGALEGRLNSLALRFQHFLDGARSLALLDTLTQLPNRRFFVEQLELELSAHQREKQPIALLFVDIDKFKEINDSFGHSTGDLVLIEVSRRLRQLIAPHDFLARYGGDEFVILHQLSAEEEASMSSAEAAILRFAERIAASFEGPIDLGGIGIELSLSLGITLLDPDLPHPEVAIQQCDLAMLKAKRDKHNRIAIFSLRERALRDSDYELYADLMQAIREHQLSVLYQPIVDGDGQTCGVEALARWIHPQRGPIPPDLFVSLAERHRQMHRLGDELLNQSLKGYRAIRQLGGKTIGLSLNISPSQLEDPSLVQRIQRQLERQQLPPSSITLELTERGILEASVVVTENLQQLRRLGIRLSLDDFGTGYSSLSLLSQLRPDEVKIDRSFIVAMATDPYALQIVTLISRMAPSLGFELVAEGVEDPERVLLLQRMGIHRFQGYWFARPLDSSCIDVEQRLPLLSGR